MIRHDTFDASDVFAAMDEAELGRPALLPSGVKFKARSSRLVLFKTKGAACVECEIKGSFFALESHNGETPHLNFYAVNEKGQDVLMTKDHIFPKSKGGADAMDNYQTMCGPCNFRKADRLAA